MSDLVVLCADKPMEAVVQALLKRSRAMEIDSRIDCTFLRHFERDSGIRTTGHEVLRAVARQHEYAVMLCDFEGSGTAARSALELEAELDRQLRNSWGEKSKCIVLEPELDIWMWGADSLLCEVLGWEKSSSPRRWLCDKGFEIDAAGKPARPKEAMEAMFREIGLPMSAAVYKRVASRISLKRCSDAAFGRFSETIRGWYPARA